MTSFEKAKMEYVESKVNSMFDFVKFKLFETQINGGEKPSAKQWLTEFLTQF